MFCGEYRGSVCAVKKVYAASLEADYVEEELKSLS